MSTISIYIHIYTYNINIRYLETCGLESRRFLKRPRARCRLLWRTKKKNANQTRRNCEWETQQLRVCVCWGGEEGGGGGRRNWRLGGGGPSCGIRPVLRTAFNGLQKGLAA
jgi:hypothetical protein